MGLDVGKITALLEVNDQWSNKLQHMARETSKASQVLGGDLARSARTAEAAMAGVGTAADKAAESARKMEQRTDALAESNRRAAAYIQKQAATAEQALSKQYAAVEKATDKVIAAQNKAAEATERSASRQSGAMEGMARKLVAAFAVERIISYGAEVVKMASHVNDAAAVAGMTTTEFQRLQYAGTQSGAGVDAITRAATQLSDRLTEGKSGTVAALQDMGLSLEALQRLSPARAMEEVADAVARIPDPMRQSQVALELFGRGGAELLPAMKAGLKSVGDEAERLGLVIREKDITALDNMGDAWDKVALRAKVATAGMLSDAMRIGSAISDVLGKMLAPGPVGQRMLAAAKLPGGGNPLVPLSLLASGVEYLTGSGQQGLSAMKPLSSHVTDAVKLMASHGPDMERTTERLRKQGKAIGDTAIAAKAYVDAMRPVIGVNRNLDNAMYAKYGVVGLSPGFGNVPGVPSSSFQMGLPANANAGMIGGAFNPGHGNFGGQSSGSGFWDGRGGAAVGTGIGMAGSAAVGAMAGGDRYASMVGSVASAAGGAMLAGTISSTVALGAATMGIGVAAVGVYMLAKHYFTVSKEVKQARLDVQAFQDALWKTMTPMQIAESGGEGWAATLITVRDAYERMGYSAGIADHLVAKLLDTSKPDAAREAMAQINTVVGAFQKALAAANTQMGGLLGSAMDLGQRLPDALLASLARLRDMGDLSAENIALLERLTKAPSIDYRKFEEAAGRYGINQDALGQGYHQSKATTTAQQMIDDVDLLNRGGASMGTILHGMREEISALVSASLQFGTTLPENMRPWIDRLAETGQLVDENGEAIKGLANLRFAESLETSFSRIADSIQKLVDLLTGPLMGAFNALPKSIGLDVDVNTPGGGQTQPHPYDDGTESTGFAGGTISRGSWFRNFGAGTPTVLHGTEAVVRPDQTGAFVSAFGGGAAGGRGGDRPVVLKLRDNRILAEVVAQELDGLLTRRGVRR